MVNIENDNEKVTYVGIFEKVDGIYRIFLTDNKIKTS